MEKNGSSLTSPGVSDESFQCRLSDGQQCSGLWKHYDSYDPSKFTITYLSAKADEQTCHVTPSVQRLNARVE